MVMAWLAFGDILRITDVIALAVTAVGIALVQWRKRPAVPGAA